MTGHRAIVEAGPGGVRRLCCGAGEMMDDEGAVALDAIDDPVALVAAEPVPVAALWGRLLRRLAHPDQDSMSIIYPTWWPASRIDLVAAAGGGDILTLPRSRALTSGRSVAGVTVVVEIAAGLVAITLAATVAEPRIGPPDQVAEAVARRVAAMTRGGCATVLIDGPGDVGGAEVLATMIAERVATLDVRVEVVDDFQVIEAAAAAVGCAPEPSGPDSLPDQGRRAHRIPALLTGGVVLGLTALGVNPGPGRDAQGVEATPLRSTTASTSAPTFLVAGRVALQVPVGWPVQRIAGGPGSARVQVMSPSDPRVVVHVVQSPYSGAPLAVAAESLELALKKANAKAGTEAGEVFVDFNPTGMSAGRPAVTYREVRDTHHTEWTVLVDGALRIGIGCQSPAGETDALRAVCDQAVRSAHALG